MVGVDGSESIDPSLRSGLERALRSCFLCLRSAARRIWRGVIGINALLGGYNLAREGAKTYYVRFVFAATL
jgi:hypothetical protein